MAILQEGYDALGPILHHHERVSCIEIPYLQGGKKQHLLNICLKILVENMHKLYKCKKGTTYNKFNHYIMLATDSNTK